MAQNSINLTTLPAALPSANGRPDHLNPALANFLAAREALQQREQALEHELGEIRRLLAGGPDRPMPAPLATAAAPIPPTPTPTTVRLPANPPPGEQPAAQPAAPRAVRRSNAGLRQAVIALLTQHGPLTKNRIVELLVAQNFEFFGKPKPALDPVLYSRKFQRQGKAFGLAPQP